MLWAFLVLIFLSKTVFAQADNANYFIEPGPAGTAGDFSQNNVYVVGSQISMRWSTNFTELSVVIYQNDNKDFIYLPGMKFVTTTTFYRWTVDLMTFDITKGSVFFFDIFAEDGTGRQLSSHYFNISKGVSSPSSSFSSSSSIISSTALPSSSTLAAASFTTTPSAGITATPPPQATSSSSGLSTGAKAGIGIGVALGVIGAAAAAFILLLQRRRSKSEKAPPPQDAWYPMDMPNKNGGLAGDGQHVGVPAGGYTDYNPHEMPTASEPQELPGAGFDSPRVSDPQPHH